MSEALVTSPEDVLDDFQDEDVELTEVFVIDEDRGELESSDSWSDTVTQKLATSENSQARDAAQFLYDVQVVAKSVQGSRQVLHDLAAENDKQFYTLSGRDAVPPPYSPELMMTYSQSDEVIHACVRAKAFDATQRGYSFDPSATARSEEITETSDEFKDEVKKLNDFLLTCNHKERFVDVLQRAAMDTESIGWGAIEVVRNAGGQVSKIDHIPASRIQPLKGMRGFKEISGEGGSEAYYQVFGDKYLSPDRVGPRGIHEPYDPRLDASAVPNFVDYQTGEKTSDIKRAANEVIWITKPHPATVYYGVTDTVAALQSVSANIHIRQFLLQFFEHNTIPRYVVIVKGAKLDDRLKKEIQNFFQTKIKGRAHKTMMLPIPKGGANVEVKFERLDSDPKDGWFRNTQTENQHTTRIAHGVPAAVAGFNDNASLGSGKTLGQVELYKDRVVVPLQSKWAELVNRLTGLGLGIVYVQLKFNELDVRDRESLMRTNTAYLDRGVKSINEVRQELGYAPIEGGSRHFLKVGNGILFLDEIDKLRSGPVVNMNPDSIPESKRSTGGQHGGDHRTNVPAQNSATMTTERAAETIIQNEGKTQ